MGCGEIKFPCHTNTFKSDKLKKCCSVLQHFEVLTKELIQRNRQLQNAFHSYVTKHGFKLEKGLPKEETNRKHYSIKEFKQITNFEKTKELLENMTLELPKVPELKDMKKVMIGRDDKILNEIIKPII